jgi:hypothetical protein
MNPPRRMVKIATFAKPENVKGKLGKNSYIFSDLK